MPRKKSTPADTLTEEPAPPHRTPEREGDDFLAADEELPPRPEPWNYDPAKGPDPDLWNNMPPPDFSKPAAKATISGYERGPQAKADKIRRAFLIRKTSKYKIYYCHFSECPSNNSEIKVPRDTKNAGPKFHKACKEIIDERRQILYDAENGVDFSPSPHVTPETSTRTNGPICGAKRAERIPGVDPGVCCMPAGWGTDHPGYGSCRHHWGNSQKRTKEAAAMMVQENLAFYEEPTLGSPRKIDPHTAILEEVHRTAGHVEWLRILIGTLGIDPSSEAAYDAEAATGLKAQGVGATLKQMTKNGIEPSVWMQLYQDERSHLIRACKAAVDMGCAERTVQIAEDQGRLIAMLIQRVLNAPEISMTNAQKVHIPAVVRREMLALGSGSTEPSDR